MKGCKGRSGPGNGAAGLRMMTHQDDTGSGRECRTRVNCSCAESRERGLPAGCWSAGFPFHPPNYAGGFHASTSRFLHHREPFFTRRRARVQEQRIYIFCRSRTAETTALTWSGVMPLDANACMAFLLGPPLATISVRSASDIFLASSETRLESWLPVRRLRRHRGTRHTSP